MVDIDKIPEAIRDQFCEDQQASRDKEQQLKEMMKEAERIAWADVIIRREEKLRESDPGQLELFEAAYNLSTPRMPEFCWSEGSTVPDDDDDEEEEAV